MTSTRSPVDRGAVLLGLTVVVLANARYLAGLSRILDPAMSMEPFYIDMAQRAASDILVQDPSWGSLYALWLKPLRAWFGDPLHVYSANVHALSLGFTVAIYCYVLLLTRRVAVATGAAFFVLISDLNVPLSSKVCTFATVVVLVGLILAERARSTERRLAVAAGGVLIASFVRPELYVAGLCLWLVAIWVARHDLLDGRRSTLLWIAAGTTILALTAWLIGTPIWSHHHENDRLFHAFREHFGWNWVRWNGESLPYLAVWQREFGAADSLSEAWWSNPSAVARHLADNLVGVLRTIFIETFSHYPLVAPANWPRAASAENLLVATAAMGGIVAACVNQDTRARALSQYYRLLPLAVASVVSIGMGILIFPSRHYLLIPAVCVILVASLAAALLLPELPIRSWFGRASVALVCLAVTRTPFVLPADYFAPDTRLGARVRVTRDVTDTIMLIRSLGLPGPVHVLTFTDGLGELLGPGFREIKVWTRGNRSLKDFILEEQIDVIVTMEPGRFSFLLDDPHWDLIQQNPAAAGFASVPTPGGGPARVWVRISE